MIKPNRIESSFSIITTDNIIINPLKLINIELYVTFPSFWNCDPVEFSNNYYVVRSSLI